MDICYMDRNLAYNVLQPHL